MIPYIVRRVLISIPIIWGVITLTFFGYHLIPGDPVEIMLQGKGTLHDRIVLRHELGLDQPLPTQYWNFLKGAIHLDFGHSIVSHQTVWHDILERLPTTIQLALPAFLVATVAGLIAGALSAFFHRHPLGLGITGLAVFGISVPDYVVGTLLSLVFGVTLGWLPVAGTGGLRYFVLPVATLAIPITAVITRLVRVSVLQQLSADYTRTAHAKGLRSAIIVYRHVLRNALIPVVTVLGTILASLLSGAVIVEFIYNWPGLGSLAVSSANARDFPVIEGLTFFFAVLLIGANLVVDITYAIIDPRIHYS